MHITTRAQLIATSMKEHAENALYDIRYHHSAKSLERCIWLGGQRFMVRRLSWMNMDFSYFHEYSVYLPMSATSGFAEYSNTSYFEGWGAWDGRYGDIASYCPLERFAHLPAWSRERGIIVRSYYAMLEAVAREISRMAFPEDFEVCDEV